MKKQRRIHYEDDFQKKFIELFRTLAGRYSSHQVWQDFLVMSACSIANACDKRFAAEREKRYMDAISKYGKEEAVVFPELFATVVLALDNNPEQDFLGSLFGKLQLHNHWHGQFFTPYHIGSFMAKINAEDCKEQLKTKEVISVSDPCCGAGCLLIAFANEMSKAGINFQRRIFFAAQDIDMIAGLMCYIQLSLLGCTAVVKIGNSLTDPFTNNEPLTEKLWFTPMYMLGDSIRLAEALISLKSVSTEETRQGPEEPETEEDKVSGDSEVREETRRNIASA